MIATTPPPGATRPDRRRSAHPIAPAVRRPRGIAGRVGRGRPPCTEAVARARRPTDAEDGEQRVPQGPEHDAGLEELLIRSAGGDREAFTGVYDALVGSVLGLAHRILRDSAQAEEVAQDVMIEVWRTADRYRLERGTARTWVLTLAHRRAVDRVRAVQASADRERRAAMLSSARSFDEVAETVEGRDEYRRVYRCLGGLDPVHRVPLVLAYYEGLTCLEVADSLSTPAGTVKSRMRAGLRKLRACLEGGS